MGVITALITPLITVTLTAGITYPHLISRKLFNCKDRWPYFFANISFVDCKNTRLFYAKIDDGVFDVKISLVKTELTTYCKLFLTTIASNFVINKDRWRYFFCEYFSCGLQEYTIVYDMISILMSSYLTVFHKIFPTSNIKKIVLCKDRWWCFWCEDFSCGLLENTIAFDMMYIILSIYLSL